MYGADYEDRKMRGQDVNQGADKPCPYELKTVTTRYFFRKEVILIDRVIITLL